MEEVSDVVIMLSWYNIFAIIVDLLILRSVHDYCILPL